MAKTFSQIPQHTYNQAKPETSNRNLDRYLSEFNGKLDSNNMPVDTITKTNLVPPQNVSGYPVVGAVTKIASSFPTQSYFRSRRSSSFEGGGDVWTPMLAIDLDQDPWFRGYNNLTDYSNFSNFPIQATCKEGMISGCATIDWHHGCQVFNLTVPESDPPISTAEAVGYGWWTQWGVFVNNILVATSGRIYPRRHTTQIPFSVPVGSQDVVVDVRFITNTWREPGGPINEDNSTNLYIFSADLWIRNTYR